MKRKKYWNIVVLMTIMLLGMTQDNGLAASKEKNYNNEFIYTIQDDDYICIRRYIGTAEEVTIPETIDGKKVKSISSFTDRTLMEEEIVERVKNVRKVNLPDTIEFIGSYAFEYCISLESITIPKKVTELREGTFMDCTSLKEVHLNQGLKYIDSEVFSGCYSLKELYIPASVNCIYGVDFYTNVTTESPYLKHIKGAGWLKTANLNVKGSFQRKKANEFLDKINALRKKKKLSKLTVNTEITEEVIKYSFYASIVPADAGAFTPLGIKLERKQFYVNRFYTLERYKNDEGVEGRLQKIFKNCAREEDAKSIGIACMTIDGYDYYHFILSSEKTSKKRYADTNKIYKESILFDTNEVEKLVPVTKKVTLTKGSSKKIKSKVLIIEEERVDNRTAGGRVSVKDLSFKSLNPKKVKVNKKGKITALKSGTAKIKVRLKARPEFSYTMKVKVE